MSKSLKIVSRFCWFSAIEHTGMPCILRASGKPSLEVTPTVLVLCSTPCSRLEWDNAMEPVCVVCAAPPAAGGGSPPLSLELVLEVDKSSRRKSMLLMRIISMLPRKAVTRNSSICTAFSPTVRTLRIPTASGSSSCLPSVSSRPKARPFSSVSFLLAVLFAFVLPPLSVR